MPLIRSICTAMVFALLSVPAHATTFFPIVADNQIYTEQGVLTQFDGGLVEITYATDDFARLFGTLDVDGTTGDVVDNTNNGFELIADDLVTPLVEGRHVDVFAEDDLLQLLIEVTGGIDASSLSKFLIVAFSDFDPTSPYTGLSANGAFGATMTVFDTAVIPLPATLPLLATGIAGLIWTKRRKTEA